MQVGPRTPVETQLQNLKLAQLLGPTSGLTRRLAHLLHERGYRPRDGLGVRGELRGGRA